MMRHEALIAPFPLRQHLPRALGNSPIYILRVVSDISTESLNREGARVRAPEFARGSVRPTSRAFPRARERLAESPRLTRARPRGATIAPLLRREAMRPGSHVVEEGQQRGELRVVEWRQHRVRRLRDPRIHPPQQLEP